MPIDRQNREKTERQEKDGECMKKIVKPLEKIKAAFTDTMTEREKRNNETAYRMATEGMVLLKNEQVLPMKPTAIALFGAGARRTVKGGTGSGEVNERHAISIWEGLKQAGFSIVTESWLKEYDLFFKEREKRHIQNARKKMWRLDFVNFMGEPFQIPIAGRIQKKDIERAKAKTAIYVVARQAGEASDRKNKKGDYMLSDAERDSIRLCCKSYEKVIVILNTGGPMDMSFLEEIPKIACVIFYGQQGSQGGRALADLMTGKVNFSGKLTDSWPRTYNDIFYGDWYGSENKEPLEDVYKEDIYVGYRYYDTFDREVAFPFGFGLSYTTFGMTMEELNILNDRVAVRVRVKNQGACYSGKEVVQVYAKLPAGQLQKEKHRLVAFVKTKTLMPGEETEEVLNFPVDNLKSYDPDRKQWILEEGSYDFEIGSSSRRIIDHKRQLLHKETGLHKENGRLEEAVRTEDQTKTESYLATLTIPEMLHLLCGEGSFSRKKSYIRVPGNVGETTKSLRHKKIPDVAMADGPAGLRLQRRAGILKNGKIRMIDPEIQMMNYFPKWIQKHLMADAARDTVIYQFTTAFPTAACVAQTWNTGLMEEFGKAVSGEMTEYGISVWLAPAMNIHRNPLCGRNFEYFSEDPLLSAKAAGAIVRGVQKNSRNIAVIKHFCCNNREDKRNRMNAAVSERALEEIYLRGFQMVIQESAPKGLMTSYNKVNGQYVMCSRELVEKKIRNEWDFDGVIMTDWNATGWGEKAPHKAILAGVDLIMPGGLFTYLALYIAWKKGQLKEETIRKRARHTLQMIFFTNTYQEYRKQPEPPVQ